MRPGFLLLALAVQYSDAAAAATPCTWTPTPTPPPSRWMSAAATAISPDAVAFCGGTRLKADGQFGLERNTCATFTTKTKVWHVLPNMTARSAPAAATLEGRLYVFGGVQKKQNASHSDPDPTIKLSVVESIDVSSTSGTWRRETDMPFGPRESPAAVSLPEGQGIVIAGGFNSGTTPQGVFEFQYFNDSYLFDGDHYTRLPDMPFSRSNFNLVATKDADATVYAFGGGETDPSYSTCARLKVAQVIRSEFTFASKWEACPALVDPRSWAAAGVINGAIVMTGGMDGRFSPTAETDVLRLSAGSTPNNWTDAGCDLPVAAGFLSGAVTGNGEEFVVVAGAAMANGAYVYSSAGGDTGTSG